MAEVQTISRKVDTVSSDVYEYQSLGIAGLQLQLSKWIVNKYLSRQRINLTIKVPRKRSLKNLFDFSIRLPGKLWALAQKFVIQIAEIVFWLLCLVLLYIVPLVFGIVILYMTKIGPLIESNESAIALFNIYVLLALLLIIMVIYTLISNLILYSLYFTELIDLKDNVTKKTLARFKNGSKLILDYYTKKQLTNAKNEYAN